MKIIFRVVLFLVVFTGTALIVNTINNRGSGESYVELQGTTLPVVFTCVDDEILSPMPAYLEEMDAALLRDAVVPLLGDNRTVAVYLDERDCACGQVRYELRNPVDGNLIEEGEMTLLQEQREGMSGYTAELRMDLGKRREYTFVTVVALDGGRSARFYSRVIRLDKEEVKLYLAAADAFCQRLLSEKNQALKDEIESYMLSWSAEDFDRTDLGYVTLQSTYDTLVWGDLSPEPVGEKSCSLTELSDTSGTVVYRYRVSTMDEETKRITYYDVEEQVDLEYVPEKASAKVMDYYRRMRKNYRDDDFDRDRNALHFGLSDRQPEYSLSKDNEYMLFAEDDTVWYYDYNASTVTRLYGAENNSFIYGLSQGVKILYVDSEDAYFAIYGRQDSGKNEGENGILIQHFRLQDRTIEECAFIHTNLPYAWLKGEVESLLFLDWEKQMLYYLLGQNVHELSLESAEDRVLAGDLPVGGLLSSADGTVIAFPDTPGTGIGYDRINLWDLENDVRTVISREGMKLNPLNFVGTDFVYGVAKQENVRIAADGELDCRYSSVVFVGRDGHEEKNYRKEGILVSGVTFLNNTIYLERVSDGESGTAAVQADYISYKAVESKGLAVLTNASGSEGYWLTFPAYIYITSVPEQLVAKLNETGGKELTVTGRVSSECAYLYVAGELEKRSARIGALVRDAAEIRGRVILSDGSLLYRSKTGAPFLTVAEKVSYIKAESGEDGYAACLTMALNTAGVSTDITEVRAFLAQDTGTGSWEDAFAELSGGSRRGLNLSGADLDTALLFLGDGLPFATRLGEGYVLVVSFNSDAIRYYDPLLGYEVRTDRSGFRNKVAAAGNEFYTYVE